MEVGKSSIIKLSKKKIKCPVCKKQSKHEFMPFCSKKCSNIDLMKWLSDEKYINIENK